jgi:hypothetical protein
VKILGAFAELRQVIISIVMSVRPSVCPHGTTRVPVDGFSRYFTLFRKSVAKIKLASKYDKNNGYFTWRPMWIYDNISLHSSYNETCLRQKMQRKSKHKFYVQKLFSESRIVYEIMWKNMVEPGRPQMTIKYGVGKIRFACRLRQVCRHTVIIFNTHCFSTATMVTQKRLIVALYANCLSF